MGSKGVWCDERKRGSSVRGDLRPSLLVAISCNKK
jgi:hypothetical protein